MHPSLKRFIQITNQNRPVWLRALLSSKSAQPFNFSYQLLSMTSSCCLVYTLLTWSQHVIFFPQLSLVISFNLLELLEFLRFMSEATGNPIFVMNLSYLLSGTGCRAHINDSMSYDSISFHTNLSVWSIYQLRLFHILKRQFTINVQILLKLLST